MANWMPGDTRMARGRTRMPERDEVLWGKPSLLVRVWWGVYAYGGWQGEDVRHSPLLIRVWGMVYAYDTRMVRDHTRMAWLKAS